MAEVLDDVVGSRCVCDGDFGTIRFIGSVPPTNGEWIGVEWDDPTRGKHDGTYEGVRYFTCSKNGNCGSFVRRKKLLFGLTYRQAIEKKYGETHVEDEDITIGDIRGSAGKKVEMYGFEKQAEFLSHFVSLSNVTLRESCVSSAGTLGEISAITPNLTSLDLSKSLLSSWEEVGNITHQLPNLRKLLLSENQLLLTDSVSSDSFKHITILYIGKMGINWNQLSKILLLMPCLEELYAYKNNITTLGACNGSDTQTSNVFPKSLQILYLDSNYLTKWNDILQLQALPHLKTLDLTGNQLTNATGLNEDSFPCLETLSLSDNAIVQWSEINSLNVLRSFETFRFIGNPVHKDEKPFYNRQLTIARLPSIKYLNNSEVTKPERVESERYYIKKHIHEWLTAEEKGRTDDFLKVHPLYLQHTKVHGLPAEVMDNRSTFSSSSSSTSSVAALKNRLISITVSFPERPDLPVLNKKLPDSMTVQKLKGLLQRVFKIKTSDQHLSYKSQKMSGEIEIELDDDLKQLSYYSIESGDVILLRTSHDPN